MKLISRILLRNGSKINLVSDDKDNLFRGVGEEDEIDSEDLDFGESEKERADKINKMRTFSINDILTAVALTEEAGFCSIHCYPCGVEIAEGELGHNSTVRYKLCN